VSLSQPSLSLFLPPVPRRDNDGAVCRCHLLGLLPVLVAGTISNRTVYNVELTDTNVTHFNHPLLFLLVCCRHCDRTRSFNFGAPFDVKIDWSRAYPRQQRHISSEVMRGSQITETQLWKVSWCLRDIGAGISLSSAPPARLCFWPAGRPASLRLHQHCTDIDVDVKTTLLSDECALCLAFNDWVIMTSPKEKKLTYDEF
jgi:hypothetical protein